LYFNTTGSNNIGIGYKAGYDPNAGPFENSKSVVDDNMILIGMQSTRDTNTTNDVKMVNGIAIGYRAKVGCSNCFALGGLGANEVNVGIGSSTPYASLSVVTSGTATTTLALKPAASQTANILDIYNTSGVLSSVFTAGGALGVGTTSPAVKLDVNGYVKVLQTSTTTACSSLIQGSIFYNQANNNFWGCADSSTWTNLGAGTVSGGGGGTGIVGASTLTGQFPFYNSVGTTLTATSSLFVSQTGNIGIGTTTPLQKLDMIAGGAYGYNGISLMYASTTRINYFFGQSSGNLTATGTNNLGIGYQTLVNIATGTQNVAVGTNALPSNIGGSSNNALGVTALQHNIYGSNNNAFGASTLANSLGDSNSAFGHQALNNNTSGAGNAGFGAGALLNNTTGGNNTGLGPNVLYFNTTGSNNIGIGYKAGYDTTIGGGSWINSKSIIDDNMILIGTQATRDINTTNDVKMVNGIAIGYQAKVGCSNCFALGGLGSTNEVNVGIGSSTPYASLSVVTSGTATTTLALKPAASQTANILDIYNTSGALSSVMTSGGALGVGTTSPWRTFSVNGTMSLQGITSSSVGNALCITANNEVTTASVAACAGVSSRRFKHDILNDDLGLPTILNLRPVTFKYNQGYGDSGKDQQFGLIAEEVQQIDPRLIILDSGGLPTAVRYDFLPMLLIKAVQEQQLQIDALTGSSTTPNGYSSGFISSLFERFLEMLSTAAVTIKDLVAESITASVGNFKHVNSDEVNAVKICVGQTCVTETQLKLLLQNANVSAVLPDSTTTPSLPSASTVVSNPSPTPTPSSTTTSTITPEPSVSPTPPPLVTLEPTPTASSTPTVTPEPQASSTPEAPSASSATMEPSPTPTITSSPSSLPSTTPEAQSTTPEASPAPSVTVEPTVPETTPTQ
jgi:hypothetical protein